MTKRRAARLLPQIGMRQEQPSPFKNLQPSNKNRWYDFKNQSDTSADLFIYDEIGGWWGVDATQFVKDLQEITAKTLNVHINSPGGSAFDGVAIYNALVQHPAEVNVIVDALAASAASFIAQAGDSITMLKGSMMMIHGANGFTYGNAAEHTKTADILNKITNNIAEIYATRAGGDTSAWVAIMEQEAWYTAQEAVDAGLADSVSKADAVEDPTNHWDLSIFNYAGRDKAPAPSEIRSRVFSNILSKGANAVTASTNSTTKSESQQNDAQQQEPTNQTGNSAVVTNSTPVLQFFMCDGKQVSDPVAVQNYIRTLESAADETRITNVKNFVAGLVEGNKILAAKQDEMEEFALDLRPEQYAKWVASWNAVPSSSLLANHASGTVNHDGKSAVGSTATDAQADKIATAQAIVQRHKMGGMKQENLEKTGSWKLLVANNALPKE